ncbi:MAG TPA: TetR family transcriptional regulator C-terminal domain-containing protein [Gemmatimonadaceae bacterium]|nr:TetR family transcriptional regulator C-terminal domain-containing protein [Gemmatimonadaceae bacterium]
MKRHTENDDAAVPRRTREPGQTRQKILGSAFHEIYRRGFQAASLDGIVADAGVTKGALYHHFPDKASLGYAVVDDVIRGHLLARWLGPLEGHDADPLTALQNAFRARAKEVQPHEAELGCPLNNLAQEMSPLDEEFRARIEAVFDQWRAGFADALERAKTAGTVREDVDSQQVATFLVAAAEGSFGLAKNARSLEMFRSNMEMLARYLETLRARA